MAAGVLVRSAAVLFVAAAVGLLAPRRVWAAPLKARNVSHLDIVVDGAAGPNAGALKPVPLVAPRGGIANGQVALQGGVGGASARAADLGGPGKIPASCVTARFTVDRHKVERSWPLNLTDDGPDQDSAGLFISVAVPADAKPGLYTGDVTVSRRGSDLKVPLSLTVAEWLRTPPARQIVRFDLNCSQESIAKGYGVKMWSPEHWALMERSLQLCSSYGSKTLFVPAVAQGIPGLTESMLRYGRGKAGWTVDASRLDRYLALQMQTGVTPDVIQLFVNSGRDVHPSRGTEADLAGVRPFTVTGTDGTPIQVAPFGADAVALYKAAFDAAYASLKKAGIPASALVAGGQEEHGPSKFFVAQIKQAAPEAMWYLAAHDQRREIQGVKVGYGAIVRPQPDWDGEGWRNPRLLTNYDYDNGPNQGPARNRTIAMAAINGKFRGVGHVSADWFGAGDYLWTGGQPTMKNWGPAIFQQGKSGAEHTVSSLVYLESLQDAEAAVTILAAAAAGNKDEAGLKAASEMMCRGDNALRLKRYDFAGGAGAWIPESLPELQIRLYAAAARVAASQSR